ncbi:hypothetical protein [Streptomyces radicis]|uniref:Uncharacterized protein n=1 Tax=Streptomyces radicis TaxID=1750517 RepID=A0A3A9WCE5_9ACTN|nr:hypothetical protein [Streptomyces radicis]RKN11021.1 hypothetical protein D7319_07835 [Streptomyces radicis]RKN25284.1 hypothetical protein D7318_08690 [Streptomyces radicis]
MPDDLGGLPFRDGEGPSSEERRAADEAFASLVLDDDFVEAAEIHEPTAAERILFAAMERAESEAAAELGLYYRDPDIDPGGADGLAGFEGPDSLDSLDPSTDLSDPSTDPERADAFDGFDGEDPDDEGRFDRSDYTRYATEDPEEQDGVAVPPAFAPAPPPPAHAYARFGGDGGAHARAHPPHWGTRGPGWRPARWQRPVACVLAMVMGISVIAFALIAVQRSGSAPSRDPGPGEDERTVVEPDGAGGGS